MNKAFLIVSFLTIFSAVEANWIPSNGCSFPTKLPTCAASLESCNPSGTGKIVADSTDTIISYNESYPNTPFQAAVEAHWLDIDGYTWGYRTYFCTWTGDICPIDSTYNIATGACVSTQPNTTPTSKSAKTLGQPAACGSINAGVGE